MKLKRFKQGPNRLLNHSAIGVAMGYHQLKAVVVSDVHLSNQPYDETAEPENPYRRHFRVFLTQLAEEYQASDHLLLILNGDILDITGSWYEDTLPWAQDSAAVETALTNVVTDILDRNQNVVKALQDLLEHDGVEIRYVFGNHDFILKAFPSVQSLIRERLSRAPSSQQRITFTSRFNSTELSLFVEHGQQFDPFNHDDYREDPPAGDIITILIMNRFVGRVMELMAESGYSESMISEIQGTLQDVDSLRPIALGPFWLDHIAHQYKHLPECQGRRLTIAQIFHQVEAETALAPDMIHILSKRLHVPRFFLKSLLSLLVYHPKVLPFLSMAVSQFMNKTRSNRYQLAIARDIQQKTGHHLITFGHTHIPGLVPLSEDGYFFNTGSWKPVINLFKPPAQLIAHGKMPFNKIDRCGVFYVSREISHPRQPSRFSLMTLENGLAPH